MQSSIPFSDFLFLLAILISQLVVVALIWVIARLLSVSIHTTVFKILQWSWMVDLCYIFLSIVELFREVSFYQTNLPVRETINFLDILQFALLYYTLAKTDINFWLKKYVVNIGGYWFLIGGIILGIDLFWDAMKFNFVPHLNLHLLPNIAYNFLALILIAQFWRNVTVQHRVNYVPIFFGMWLYALAQIVAIFEIPAISFVSLIGWMIGLCSKVFICYGLLLMFRGEASKSRKLEIILLNLFHELRNLLYGIDVPAKKILLSKQVNAQTQAREISKNYEAIYAMIDATYLILQKELTQTSNRDTTLAIDMDSLVTTKMAKVSLNALVEIAMKLCKNFTRHDVRFHNDYGGGCEIECHTHEIIQILVNLIKNSYESFDEGTGDIYITTRNKYTVKENESVREVRSVYIEIVDNGCGIPLEIQDKIYELRYTTKGKKGNGLGLAIVKTLIDQKYGVIKFESPVQNNLNVKRGGTKFVIYFSNN